MGFGRILLGALLVGGGGLLMAEQLGLLPGGTALSLLAYWPVLLIAGGLTLLANAIKNAIVGWAGVALVLGGAAVGAWWLTTHPRQGPPTAPSSIDLVASRAETLTFQGSSTLNTVRLGASTHGRRRLEVDARGTLGGREAAHAWSTYRGAGLLRWPAVAGASFGQLVGGELLLRAPARTPVRLDGATVLGAADLDLTRLRAERCKWRLYGSTLEAKVGARAGRGAVFHVNGGGGRAVIRIPADAPVRLETSTPFILTRLPSDFIEHAHGRSHWYDHVYTSDGSGPPLRIVLDGWFLWVDVKREPSSAL